LTGPPIEAGIHLGNEFLTESEPVSFEAKQIDPFWKRDGALLAHHGNPRFDVSDSRANEA